MQIDTLEATYSYLCQGGESLSILINFYKTYKKLQEEMALKLSDISMDLECNEMIKPLSSAIGSSAAYIKLISAKHFNMAQ